MVKLPRLNPSCVTTKLLIVALPKLLNFGEVTVALPMVKIVELLGVITTLLAFTVKASPTPRLNVPTEILKVPLPLLPKSNAAEKLLRLEVNAVEPGKSRTLDALTPMVPENAPVEFV